MLIAMIFGPSFGMLIMPSCFSDASWSGVCSARHFQQPPPSLFPLEPLPPSSTVITGHQLPVICNLTYPVPESGLCSMFPWIITMDETSFRSLFFSSATTPVSAPSLLGSRAPLFRIIHDPFLYTPEVIWHVESSSNGVRWAMMGRGQGRDRRYVQVRLWLGENKGQRSEEEQIMEGFWR